MRLGRNTTYVVSVLTTNTIVMYIALISRVDNSHQHYVKSSYNETKERFIERMKNCYIKPYSTPYFNLDIYELGECIY
jgi:hypothetical protein